MHWRPIDGIIDDLMPTREEMCARHRWMFARSEPGARFQPIEFDGGSLEVGEGWLPLLDRALNAIASEVRKMPAQERARFYIAQIKEKYGTLSIYATGCNERITELIINAEELSEKVCEACGAFGMLHVFNEDQWFWTLCPPCARKRANERNMTVAIEKSQNN